MRRALHVLSAAWLLCTARFCLCQDAEAAGPSVAAFAEAAAAAGTAQSGLVQATFTPLRYQGEQSLSPTATLSWKEADWMLPRGSASTPDQWSLTQIAVVNPMQWGSTISYTTRCGFLQWSQDSRTLSYKVEVDGCADSWTYLARHKTKGWIASGSVQINVLSNNCVYANCEQPGCGSTCKCNSQLKGTCTCSSSKADTGFARAYVYARNSEGCYYKQILGAGKPWAKNVFSASVRFTKATLPIVFGKYNSPACLPALAFSSLRITNLQLTRTGDAAPGFKATPLLAYAGARGKGDILPCLSGVYQVVLEIPFETGAYSVTATLNDGSPPREIATLILLDQ